MAVVRRLYAVLVLVAAVFATTVALPATAGANATKCTHNICMYVTGKGLVVNNVRMSSSISGGKSVSIRFRIIVSPDGHPRPHPFYYYTTRTYKWSTPKGKAARTFYTDKYVNNRRVSNGWKLCAYLFPTTGEGGEGLCATVHR